MIHEPVKQNKPAPFFTNEDDAGLLADAAVSVQGYRCWLAC
jgi:hypothetical protein